MGSLPSLCARTQPDHGGREFFFDLTPIWQEFPCLLEGVNSFGARIRDKIR